MWKEVQKDYVFSKLAEGKNLAVAIFPDAIYTKNVDMSDKVSVEKIYSALIDENIKFFEETEITEGTE